jgi:Epoxide hydrolase N terminus
MAVILGDLFSNAAADGILLRHLGFANVDALWFKELVEYWANGFDWPSAKAYHNKTKSFFVSIDNRDLHFARRFESPIPPHLPMIATLVEERYQCRVGIRLDAKIE